MADELLSIAAIGGFLLIAGLVIGGFDRRNFNLKWLLVAIGLVILNDVLVTRIYGLVPLVHGGQWNWQGKAMALAGSLLIASSAWFGWKCVGLTFAQARQGRTTTSIVIACVIAVFAGIALISPNAPTDMNTIAFQATMPGLEEEIFYRGTLLFALNEAFGRRWRIGGISIGWAALLSTVLFGLAHAIEVSEGVLSFDVLPFLMTAVPALILVWVRERTGSLLWPIILHNLANTLPHVL